MNESSRLDVRAWMFLAGTQASWCLGAMTNGGLRVDPLLAVDLLFSNIFSNDLTDERLALISSTQFTRSSCKWLHCPIGFGSYRDVELACDHPQRSSTDIASAARSK